MTKFVIGPDVALRLAQEDAVIAGEHNLLAPTLLRSQLLSMAYRAVRQGKMTKNDADHHLGYVRGLRIRLLGDRVLQNAAWKVAAQFEWPGQSHICPGSRAGRQGRIGGCYFGTSAGPIQAPPWGMSPPGNEAMGSQTVMVVPSPSRLWTSISPLWARTIC